MILKSITPKHFGPFFGDSTLEIDSEVTVLTGPNDAGKSLALRAIEILCSAKCIGSHEVNRYRTGEFSGAWNEDQEIITTGLFLTTEFSKGLPNGTKTGVTITVSRSMIKSAGSIAVIDHGSMRTTPQCPFVTPSLLKLPLDTEVKQEINLRSMTDAETQLIQLGFGSAFSLAQHKSLSSFDRSIRIDEAQQRLNDKLFRIVPTSMPLSFKLLEVAANPELLGIALVDQHRGYAPLGSRGSGVKRLLNVMGALLRIDPNEGHTIVLYDEPELSLHSDAQHALRRLLEELGRNPNVQVIYTTHSPAMINSMRPETVRILQRRSVGDRAVSGFVNKAYQENYCLVRSSLGVCPSDSLLYAPITVVVEGATEIICLPLIMKKMAESGLLKTDELDLQLSQSHFLDGQGDSFEYMCRLAKSQNAKPIVFVDGDKVNEIKKVREKHPEVPLIALPVGVEFEELVPRAKYIEAAAELLELDSANVNEQTYSQWEVDTKPRPRMMFSKRVERWLSDVFDKDIDKPRTMRLAVEKSDVAEFKKQPMEELFSAMQKLGASL